MSVYQTDIFLIVHEPWKQNNILSDTFPVSSWWAWARQPVRQDLLWATYIGLKNQLATDFARTSTGDNDTPAQPQPHQGSRNGSSPKEGGGGIPVEPLFWMIGPGKPVQTEKNGGTIFHWKQLCTKMRSFMLIINQFINLYFVEYVFFFRRILYY